MLSGSTRKKIQNYSYGLAEVIGKGYSSQVYSGREDETGEKVAIKVIDMKMLKNDINRILLQSEITILKQLKNQENILNVHEIYTTKNNTYIITELCDTDLNRLIKNKLTEDEACAFMEQIIKGYLNFARRDIIHRDLKPANILVTEDRKLKIADFGFAIKVQDAAKSNKYNVGSPLYMALESLKKNQYTLKTDIWALGIIFYELLTGQTPWKAKNQKELIRKIQSQEIEKLLQALTLQTSSKAFLRKTLNLNKNQRMNLDELAKFRFKVLNQKILTEKQTNISLALKGTSKSQISINIISPSRKQNSIQNRLVQKIADCKKMSKDTSAQNLSFLHHQQSFNQSMHLKSTSTDRLGIAFDHRKMMVNKSIETPQNPQTRKQESFTNRELKCDKKQISKILIAEIHFCRFLYKLLQRLIESQKTGLLKQPNTQLKKVIVDFEAIIVYKIQKILTFKTKNFLNVIGYEQYKKSVDFPKIIKIAQQYKERYSREFNGGWLQKKCTFSSQGTYSLIQLLSMLLEQSENEQDFIKRYSKDIIALDYLITAKQLIQMLQKGENHQKFADKSRIQQIVEGKTASINQGLYRRIMERSKNLNLVTGQKQEAFLKFNTPLVEVQ